MLRWLLVMEIEPIILSISDGTKGIREINVNDLSVDKVIDFTSLDSAYEEGINCQIN